jgi:dTDP-glucose 4,6-dehydratase
MTQTNKKILITGGYGFIGGHLAQYLHANFDHEIYILDKNGYASDDTYKKYAVKSYEFDICNKKDVECVFDECGPFDYVFHLAAESHVDNSIDAPDIFVQSNVVGTANVLQAFRQQNHGRFVHVSTDEVYGHITEKESITDKAFTETDPLAPRSPYSSTKAASDLIVKSFFETYGTNVCITRCCNNFGPNQYEEKFIPTIIQNLKNGRKIPVYGTGMNVREWIHVYDHISALWMVATKGRRGEIYNIGTGRELSNIELVDLICQAFDMDMDQCVRFVEDRKGHDFKYAIDSSKIRDELLWYPLYDEIFEDKLNETIKSY